MSFYIFNRLLLNDVSLLVLLFKTQCACQALIKCPLETDKVIPLVAAVMLYYSKVMLSQNFLKVSKLCNV